MVAYPVNWCENRLGDVCNYVNGTALEEYFSNYGNRRVISLGNYSEGGKYIDDGNRINLNQKTQSFLLYKDDLSMVLNDKGNGRLVGKVLLIESDDKYIFNQRSLRIIPNKNEAIPLFLYYLINSDIFRDSLKPHIQGNTQVYINPPAVMSIPIVLPPIVEQQVIASVLSDFDEHIDNLMKLIEKKKAIRDGALEDLVSGKTRLDGFDGEWEEKCINDFIKIQRGASPRPIEYYLTNGANGVNWIKIGDAPRYGKYIETTEERITQSGANHSVMVYPDDFILSNSMSFGRPYILKVKGCIHDGWLRLYDFQENADRDFLFYLLSSQNVQSQYAEAAAGSGVQNLNKEVVKGVKVVLPSVPEQQAIAQVLIAMDEEIESLEAEKSKVIQIREGAMDDLLTGRVRLKI